MRHAINDKSHLTFENVNDLLLRVPVLGHTTPGRQRGDHLIHRLAVRDRPACNAGANFNCRVFSFHFQNLTRKHYSRESSLCCCDFHRAPDKVDIEWCRGGGACPEFIEWVSRRISLLKSELCCFVVATGGCIWLTDL